MNGSVKYQVFVSSTYEDLKDERDAVVRAILEMGHIPVGMEMFSAGDEEQWQVIARHIRESDYYVVLVAHRYGSVTGDGRSYTEKEYEYAIEQGVPVLGFVIDDEAPWPGDRTDKDAETVAALESFKKRVMSKPVDRWISARDLHGRCAIALMKAFQASPREGWVRAESQAGPGVTKELSRLSAENAELRTALAATTAQAEVAHEQELAQLDELLTNAQRRISYKEQKNGEWIDLGERSLAWVFEMLAPDMATEGELDYMGRVLAFHVREGDASYTAPLNVLRDWLADFMALGIVKPSEYRHSVNDKGEYWSLTEKGADLLSWMRRREIEAERERRQSEKLAALDHLIAEEEAVNSTEPPEEAT